MASFCQACSITIFGEDFRDLAGLKPFDDWQPGQTIRTVCEGCGVIDVDVDGNCCSPNCLAKDQPGHGCNPRIPNP